MRDPVQWCWRRSLAFALALVLGCGGSSAPRDHAHAHKGPVGHRFTSAEQWAKVFDDPRRDEWQRPADVIAACAIAPGMVVADVGAGTGYFEPHLSRAVGPAGKVLALDVEPDMIRWLKERAAREGLANVEARLVAADDAGLERASVDRVLVVDTWHHLPEREAYARELADALRPGGAIIVVDFTMESEMGPPREHRVPPEAVAAELRSAGLTAEVIAEELPEQYVVVARAP